MFMKAKDLDYGPFRALTDFNNILREISREEKDVYLVDLERFFINQAEGAAPGFDLFVDYCHPTTRGNRLIANNAFEKIITAKLLKTSKMALTSRKIKYHDLSEIEPDRIAKDTWRKLLSWFVIPTST